MFTVTIRAYADLNDFLPRERRQTGFEHAVPNPTSIKDLIEGMGIPHTEIAMLLVNDQSVDFETRIDGPCRIAAFPRTNLLPVGAENSLLPELPDPPLFVLDVHLGALARYLRLLGFDARYDNSAGDDRLIEISVGDNRMLLTRDRRLLMRRVLDHGYFVRSVDPREQAVEVIRRLELRSRIAPFTRCLACNGPIQPAEKSKVEDRLEPLTRRHYDDFWQCRACERIYWQGSHYDRLRDLVESVGKSSREPEST